MYGASHLVWLMQQAAVGAVGNSQASGISFGTVKEINPLRIQLDGLERPMHESFFILSPWCRVWEAELKIRAIKGQLAGGDSIDIGMEAGALEAFFSALGASKSMLANKVEKTMTAHAMEETKAAHAASSNTKAYQGSWSAGGSGGTASGGGGDFSYARKESLSSQSDNDIHVEGTATAGSTDDNDIEVSGSLALSSTDGEVSEVATGLGISKPSITAGAEGMAAHLSFSGGGSFELGIAEKPFEDETNRDMHRHTHTQTDEEWEGKLETGITWHGTGEADTAFYDQTFAMQVIMNRGLKVGDYVLMTHHDGKYIVWWCLNRLL